MAVRFSADGQDYTRTITLGAQSQFSISCWAKISVDRNTYQTAWAFNGSGGWNALQTSADGVTMSFSTAEGDRGARTLTAGTWYWFGVSVNGVNGTVKSRVDGNMTFTTSTWSNGPVSRDQATLMIGESPFGGDWLNGAVAAIKWWGAALSAAELEAESLAYMPTRTSNLRAWYPFEVAETTDHSGNGQTLSGGSGTTTEAGPSIPFEDSTPKSFGDTASAADSLSVATTSALAQTGAAADTVTVAAAVGLAQAASAADALALTATVAVALADAGVASQSIVSGVPIGVADTGAGVDTFATLVTPALAQAGAAADTVRAVATVGLSQAGSASDVLAGGPLLLKSIADTAVAADSVSVAIGRDIGSIGAPRQRWPVGAPRARYQVGRPRT